MAGGPDDRPIQEAVSLVMSPQERLDSPPQLPIGRALTIEDGGTVRRRLAFNGRPEHGLDAIQVERHEMVLESGTAYRTQLADDKN